PTSSADEVKRAFRQQIARYHPDKVQHLGREFQEMAADRAAELTEAYRILSDEGRRKEYDDAVAAAGGQASRADAPPQQGGAPESNLFARNTNPRLLGRFISRLDRQAVADAWKEAAKWGAAEKEDVCVLLMGTTLSPAGELAGEIALQRRKQPRTGGKLTLIPVDARVWDAHMPFDAPAIAKTLLARLKSGG